MHKPKPLINPHRLARLIAWAQAMLAWAAFVLLAPAAKIDRRHIRQRYRFLSLDWAERLVRALAIVRAMEITHLHTRARRTPRDTAPGGFRRRLRRSGALRSIAGSRFRKALKHRDVAIRLQRLVSALADIDAFARRYLVPIARRRLTRLCPVLLIAPPAAPCVSRLGIAPCPANTS